MTIVPMDKDTAVAPPAASLVIPTRNRPELLLDTVKSILQSDELPTELIIVDQSDAPHPILATLAAERGCEICYRSTKVIGVSQARNIGIAAARQEILAFTDDDVLVTPTWFGNLVRALLDAGPQSVVTGRVLPGDAETSRGFVPSTKTDELPSIYEGRIGKDVLFSNNMALYRSAIDTVGDFDVWLGAGTLFSNAEDNDLGFRLLEAGYRIIYAPDAMLYHRAWRSERDYLPLHWSYGRGQGAYYAKHLRRSDRYMLHRLWRDVLDYTVQGAYHVRRQPRKACGNAVYVLGLLSGVAQWMLAQRWRHRT